MKWMFRIEESMQSLEAGDYEIVRFTQRNHVLIDVNSGSSRGGRMLMNLPLIAGTIV